MAEWRITLDPRLGLSAFDFIITWNAIPECRATAFARTSSATPLRFDLGRVAGASVVLTGIEDSTTAEAISTLIRRSLERREIRQELAMATAGQSIAVTIAG